jgi:hypothetical protein
LVANPVHSEGTAVLWSVGFHRNIVREGHLLRTKTEERGAFKRHVWSSELCSLSAVNTVHCFHIERAETVHVVMKTTSVLPRPTHQSDLSAPSKSVHRTDFEHTKHTKQLSRTPRTSHDFVSNPCRRSWLKMSKMCLRLRRFGYRKREQTSAWHPSMTSLFCHEQGSLAWSERRHRARKTRTCRVSIRTRKGSTSVGRPCSNCPVEGFGLSVRSTKKGRTGCTKEGLTCLERTC